MNILLLTSIGLGTWRAVALGTNGTGAAGLVLSVAGLLGVTASAFERLKIRARAVIAAAVATVVLGWIGAVVLADQPVDVSSSLTWMPYTLPGGRQVPNEYQTAAGLHVPKSLNTLELRLALVNDYPDAGPCPSAAYRVQWIGTDEPGQPVASGEDTFVRVPSGVSVMDLLVHVQPGSSDCVLSLYTETARFINE